jgi:hypothetical protein
MPFKANGRGKGGRFGMFPMKQRNIKFKKIKTKIIAFLNEHFYPVSRFFLFQDLGCQDSSHQLLIFFFISSNFFFLLLLIIQNLAWAEIT